MPKKQLRRENLLSTLILETLLRVFQIESTLGRKGYLIKFISETCSSKKSKKNKGMVPELWQLTCSWIPTGQLKSNTDDLM